MASNTFEIEDDEAKVVDKQPKVLKPYLESSDVEFPMILLKVTALEQYKVNVLNAIMTVGEDSDINVYIFSEGELIKIGAVSKVRMRIMLDTPVLEGIDKSVFIDKDTSVTGDLMYALCGINV